MNLSNLGDLNQIEDHSILTFVLLMSASMQRVVAHQYIVGLHCLRRIYMHSLGAPADGQVVVLAPSVQLFPKQCVAAKHPL